MIPNTFRYCIVCEKETWFKYDKQIGHSRCKECYNHNCSLKPRKVKDGM